MSRPTSPSMQGSDESKEHNRGFDCYVRQGGSSSTNFNKTEEALENGHLLTREAKTMESSDENRPSQSPSKPHKNGILMQRWLEEIPKKEHWSSTNYHNKNKKKSQ